MNFKTFWKLSSYVNRVRLIGGDEEVLYEGQGRKLKINEYGDYDVIEYTVERGVLIITIEKEGE